MKLFLDLQAIQGVSAVRGVGRYSRGLVKALVRNAQDCEIWFGLSDRLPIPWETIDDLSGDRVTTDHIVTFSLPGETAGVKPKNRTRARIAEWIREARIADLLPDIVFLNSLFEGYFDDSTTSIGAFEPGLRTAATIYDVIPFVRPEAYLGNENQRDWYSRKIESLRRARRLLAISKATGREAVEHLGIEAERIAVVYGGVDEFFAPVPVGDAERGQLRARFALDRPFVLYVGNMDSRKNLEGIIAAFALLPAEVRDRRQLVIVCPMATAQHRHIVSVAAKSGLFEPQFVLAGFVSDIELRLLYSACELFVFPSLHEGLGLPMLEAMACGAPTIGSEASSVPEIIGRPDALFDGTSPAAIAAKIRDVLTEPNFAMSLREHGVRRVREFTWDRTACAALQAFAEMARDDSVPRIAAAAGAPGRRPRLAYLSPLPPLRSGVSDYSAELLPALAEHYDIDVVVAQDEVRDDWITSNLKVRPVDWFRRNGESFDNILYNIGNSPFHAHMFELMDLWPGTVILHDFYLSHLFRRLGKSVAPELWFRPLYDAHGLSSVRRFVGELAKGHDTCLDYSCSLPTLRKAIGVVTHSFHAQDLVRRQFGETAAAQVRVLPFPRQSFAAGDRLSARKRLGLGQDETVVCSFGFLADNKLNHRLIAAWQLAGMAGRGNGRLIFVGHLPDGPYSDRIRELTGPESETARIRITGFVEPSEYRDYLTACDVAVQLRANSRGETSASALDCLAHGVALIVNAHGSMAEFPDSAVLMITDDFTDAELAGALVELVSQPHRRKELAERGYDYACRVHDPRRVAGLMHETIDRFGADTPGGRLGRLIERIGDFDGVLSRADLAATARSIARNQDRIGPPEMLVDVTTLSTTDRTAGIERVVRNVAACLTGSKSGTPRVELVTARSKILYAAAFASREYDLPPSGRSESLATLARGDVFLGLDWNPQLPAATVELLRQRGLRSYFVVYDLLPALMPRFFPANIEPMFHEWLDRIATHADGILCISRSVADEFAGWLDSHPPPRRKPLKIGFFPLGSEISGADRTAPLSLKESDFVLAACANPAVLMVGTVEPRKGHEQALDAFEAIWREGAQTHLVIVGVAGWQIETFVQRLRRHPENGKRLFWLENASDGALRHLYESASVLLAASRGEGFGLPLAEAAKHGLPLLVRDLPIFREVAGRSATYFGGEHPDDITRAVREWFAAHSVGAAPPSTGIAAVDWTESTRRLLATIEDDEWYRIWEPGVAA